MPLRARLLRILLLCTALSCGPVAHAAMTGADFLQAAPAYQNGFVDGFVRGMYSACLDHLEARKEICSLAPVLDTVFDMAPEEVLELFLGYIKKNRESQKKEASELLVDCLKEAAHKPANPQ